jgi:RES domain-containing protein
MASRDWLKSAGSWTAGVAAASGISRLPPKRPFSLAGWHRLIPSKFNENETVLADLAADPAMLDDLVLLDGATNERVQGEQHGLIGISPFELIYGVPHAQIVNAAFLHPGVAGSRFNDSTRGAWYAAEQLETSIVEVAFHKGSRLKDIIAPGFPGEVPDRDTTTYDDWRANFEADFHTLEPAESYAEFLAPDPVPQCYGSSQALARQLLKERSNGLLYPSVRRAGHNCFACFRPALVYHPRREQRLELSLSLAEDRYRHQVRSVPSPA